MKSATRLLPLPRKCPKHLVAKRELLHCLQRWANIVYAQYGVPVYLCGSILKEGVEDPRDWDIRVCIPASVFTVRYGPPDEWWEEGQTGFWTRTRWKWVDDCRKQAIRGARYTGLNIDFEVQPPRLWRRYKDQPRLRLDTRGRKWK